jgi:hypothetical protein
MADLPTHDAHGFIAALDEVDLVRYRVVGAYTRGDTALAHVRSLPSKRVSPSPAKQATRCRKDC